MLVESLELPTLDPGIAPLRSLDPEAVDVALPPPVFRGFLDFMLLFARKVTF